MRITGTFIDEITRDIASQNWGPEQWAADFAVMRRIGIDTVILIRSGYREQAVFNSWVLRKHRPMLPVRENLGELFLDLAQAQGMTLLWGIYDPGDWEIDKRRSLDINREFMTEVHELFGDHPAFGGWYLSFEFSRNEPRQVELLVDVGRHAKELAPDLPTMISPYIAGPKAPPGVKPISRSRHQDEWSEIFHRIKECVDIVAFQDGHVDYLDIPDYLMLHTKLAREAGIACWSNVESFDRDMPIHFPPIDWRKMEYKMDAAREAGVDKLITFEFSHFMSPHAASPAAHALFERYCNRFGLALDQILPGRTA